MKIYEIVLIAVGAFIVLGLLLILLFVKHIKQNKTKQNDEEAKLVFKIIECLGGKQNINKVESKGSRLIVYYFDEKKIDLEQLKTNNVTGIIKMADKLTLVVGDIANKVKNELIK